MKLASIIRPVRAKAAEYSWTLRLLAAFFVSLSLLLIVGHKYSPFVLLDGQIREGRYLVDCGRYGVIAVSGLYWWSSMIIQLTALVLILSALGASYLVQKNDVEQ